MSQPTRRSTRFTDLPLDILRPILEHLSDRRDWHACALVNKSFNEVSTPLLYRTLDSRVKRRRLFHPSETLINRPELAKYVRHVTETGAIHFEYQNLQPNITRDTLHALTLCKNLHSLTWTDDHSSPSYVSFAIPFFHDNSLNPGRSSPPSRSVDSSDTDQQHPLLAFLSVIKASHAPLRELIIRSNNDLGSHVWSELSQLTGLAKIGVWCMEGPPRVLQGWAGHELGKTLVELELGRCAGVPPTILISVLSQLPLLQDLHIKGVQASAVLTILTFLPALRTLDTEYLNSGSGNIWPRGWRLEMFHSPFPVSPSNSHSGIRCEGSDDIRLPTLQNLTVRASSIDTMGPNKLFPWIRTLVMNSGLETFRLLTFTTNGNTVIPRGFILGMARVHGEVNSGDALTAAELYFSDHGENKLGGTARNGCGRVGLKKWIVTEAQMTLADIACVCDTFPELEELSCSTAVTIDNVDSIKEAISSARNLHTLRLHIQWIPSQRQWRPRHHHAENNHKESSPSLEPTSPSQSARPPPHPRTPSPEISEDPCSDANSVEDHESDQDSEPRPSPNHFRFSGNTGGRGAFGLGEVGLRYATSLNHRLFRGGGGSNDTLYHRHDEDPSTPSFNLNGGGRRNFAERGRYQRRPFTLEHAREMMLCEGSKLRVIAVGGVVYTGKWVWDREQERRRFEVEDAQEE